MLESCVCLWFKTFEDEIKFVRFSLFFKLSNESISEELAARLRIQYSPIFQQLVKSAIFVWADCSRLQFITIDPVLYVFVAN